MRRLTVLLVGLLVVVGTLPIAVTANGVNASVAEVTISPDSPAPDETVTITPTIRNLASSNSSLEIRSVVLRGTGYGIDELKRIDSVGTISPGTELDIPLTYTFDDEGERDLRVFVYGVNTETGEAVQLRYPVTVNVRERHPQLDIRANESVVGVESNGTVTIANGLNTPIANVELVVDGRTVEMLDDRTVFASIGSNEVETASFSFRPERVGTQPVTATLHYTINGDTERTVTRSKTIRPDELREGVSLDASAVGSGEDRALSVDVINQGNTPVESVVITADSDNATFRRAIVQDIPAGTSESVRLNATLSEPMANVDVTAEYEIGSRQRTATTATELRSAPGAITLTGLDVVREGGRLQISGSASNLGTTEASSVLVSVVDTERVTPAFPNKEYFVGTVPSSDFVSFDLYARTTGNVSSVPIEVSYLVDDEREVQRFQVDVTATEPAVPARPNQNANNGGGGGMFGGLLPVIGVGAVAALVIVVVLVRWYRRGDEEI
ncbi:hypothetical protein [Haloarcula montana]|uniref:hypothetical protein n=1 Tax=Haloarcula montana TaxID=3111776 RepID=UPI002D76CDF6|nr:hypothetical protein [Haloarcula sp. GH36]